MQLPLCSESRGGVPVLDPLRLVEDDEYDPGPDLTLPRAAIRAFRFFRTSTRYPRPGRKRGGQRRRPPPRRRASARCILEAGIRSGRQKRLDGFDLAFAPARLDGNVQRRVAIAVANVRFAARAKQRIEYPRAAASRWPMNRCSARIVQNVRVHARSKQPTVESGLQISVSAGADGSRRS